MTDQEHAAAEVDRIRDAIATHERHRPSEADTDTWIWATEWDRMRGRLAAAEQRAGHTVRVVLDDGPCAGDHVDVARTAYERLSGAAVLDVSDAATGRLRATYMPAPGDIGPDGVAHWTWQPHPDTDLPDERQPSGR